MPIASRAALVEGFRSLLDRDGPVALHLRPALAPWVARFVAACMPAQERAGTRAIRSLSQASLLRHEELARELATGVERRDTLNVYEAAGRFEHGRRAAEGAKADTRSEILVGADAPAFAACTDSTGAT